MNYKSRVKNSLLNLRVVWIWQILYMGIKFFSRRIFANSLAVEYLGTENVFANLIGLLDMAELGINLAVTAELYKPLAEKNEEEISKIMAALGWFYRGIGSFLIIGGCIITPFITMISSELNGIEYVHISFVIYVISSSLGYLLGYKSVLLSADQKNYIFVRNHYAFLILLNVMQMIVLVKTQSFFFYVAVIFLIRLMEYININRISNKNYPYLKARPVKEKQIINRIVNDVRKIALGRIANSIIQSTDGLLISQIIGLSIAGLNSNYSLIISSALAIVTQFPYSFTASIGNLVATSNEEKINELFWITFYLNTAVFSVASIVLGVLIQPFVTIWLGTDYILDYSYVLVLLIVFYITGLRLQLNSFKVARGLFQYENIRSVIECSVNLIFSIILAFHIGLIGIGFGTVISALMVGLPIELYNLRQGYNISLRKYGKYVCFLSVLTFIIGAVCLRISYVINSQVFFELFLLFGVTIIIFCLLWLILTYHTRLFKMTFSYGKQFFK